MSAAKIRHHVANARYHMDLARAGLPVNGPSSRHDREPGFFALFGALIMAVGLIGLGIVSVVCIAEASDPLLAAAAAVYLIALFGFLIAEPILAFSRRHRLYYRLCETLCDLGLRKNPF